MKVTQQEYDEWLRRNPSLAQRNPQNDGVLSTPKPERAIRSRPVETKKDQKKVPSRFRIILISYRTRHIDPDNLCPKYAIDCLRYSGAIQDDDVGTISEVVTKQEKVKFKKEERTEILIEQIA